MRNTLCALLAVLCCQFAFAQQNEALNWGIQRMGIEARADYQREYVSGDAIKENCGFKGQYLNFRVDGKFNEKLSYSYRQRLYKAQADETFFDATDWMYLKYHVNERLAFSAGKQVVAVGGYEYDRNPIDIYFGSEYWWGTRCYQWGIDAAYDFNGGKDILMAQVCQSPYGSPLEVDGKCYNDLYAFNLMWYGSHGWFNTTYSVNMVEYLPGQFINYIALGHKLNMGDFSLEFDFMNRAVRNQTFLFKDCSLIGDLTYSTSDKLNVFVKATYDVNNTDDMGDYCVLPGTEVTRVSAGIEYFLLPDKSARVHAALCQTFCSEEKAGVDFLPEQTMASVGLKWNMDLLALNPFSLFKKNINK